jgi:hypothetical protein
VDDFGDFVFGGFDAFGNFDFLLARQQRDQPHLFEIHPNGIVEGVQLAGVILIGFGSFDPVHLRLINNFDFQRAQFAENFIELVRRGRVFRQRFVDVVVSQVSLLLRKPDEILDFFRNLRISAVGRHSGIRRDVRGGRNNGASCFQGQLRRGFANLRF